MPEQARDRGKRVEVERIETELSFLARPARITEPRHERRARVYFRWETTTCAQRSNSSNNSRSNTFLLARRDVAVRAQHLEARILAGESIGGPDIVRARRSDAGQRPSDRQAMRMAA
jgi:hypothetical protein